MIDLWKRGTGMDKSGFDPTVLFTILTTIIGYIMGAFTEKINFSREKRKEIYLERKKLYLEITKMIALVPSKGHQIEKCKKYCTDLVDYYEKNMAMLLLIANTKVADEFTSFTRMYEEFVKTEDLEVYDDILNKGQNIIDLMRKIIKSED